MDGVASAEADWEKRWAKATMKPGATLDEAKARELIGRDFEVDDITRVEK